MSARISEPPAPSGRAVLTVDFGSTFTKLVAVGVDGGTVIGTASHPTTIATDVLDGYRAARRALADRLPHADLSEVHACSSAGGGLRVAVIGLEEDLTARAGRYAAMSAGARVAWSCAGGLDGAGLDRLIAATPDIVLLTGGIDGGDEASVLAAADLLAQRAPGLPVVVAGNAAVTSVAVERLRASGVPAVGAANVMPSVGVLAVTEARERIRETFIGHVIGGKDLSRGHEFRDMVRMPTPDAVLTAIELLGEQRMGAGDIVAIDVGGATTDVHSHVAAPMVRQGLRPSLKPEAPSSRTVEGDLGLRWSAPSLVEAAVGHGLLDGADHDATAAEARRLSDQPWSAVRPPLCDRQLSRLAATVAMRRHAGELSTRITPQGAVVECDGKDLRSVTTVIGSGGVFRHGDARAMGEVLVGACRTSRPDRQLLPREPAPAIDTLGVLAPAGLLAGRYPAAAARLAGTILRGTEPTATEGAAHVR